MNMEEETLLAMHSHAKRMLDVEMEAVAGQSGLVPLLDTSFSDTHEPNPTKKKSKLSSDSPAVSDSMLMRFMQRMEAMHEETIKQISW